VNSTNVRLIRGIFGVLSDAAPGVAARWAESLFFTPPRSAVPTRMRAFLATGRFREFYVDGERIAAWSWGQGPPVYLVHGWAGRGGQLAAFGPPLVLAGFTVVTFDAPGHGASSGRRSSIVDFARALRATVERFGPAAAVVAHSLGAAATAHALVDGLRARRVVFIAPPADPNDWTRRFAERLGLSAEVLDAMKVISERRLGLRWADLDVRRLGTALGVPLLVVHDRDDREVLSSDGAAIARSWPGARLVTTRGLGHHRILRDPSVVHEVVSFALSSSPRSDRESLDLLAEDLFLERYLFDRDWRWSLAKARSGELTAS
jgi:pimeloyl-ACP methyl ester carboxylesterase